jgi:hypothetical protein
MSYQEQISFINSQLNEQARAAKNNADAQLSAEIEYLQS